RKKIEAYESTLSLSQSQEISTSSSLVHDLGIKEHCGRVRGLGLGPCPSKVFGVHACSHKDHLQLLLLMLLNYKPKLMNILSITWYLIKEVCDMMHVTKKKNLRHLCL
ncbi:hypothetical protein V8G54_018414, partial [Vigna mungo]